MKKTFLTYSTIALTSLTIVSSTYAQSSNGSTPKPILSTEYTSLGQDAEAPNGAIALSEVNMRAQKNFSKKYNEVSEATWYQATGGFIVHFIKDEIKTRVAYDKKGSYLWTIREYTEDKLPFEVRDLVKSKYYDFSIYHINEVKTDNTIVYILKLEGKTTWKIVKVADSELTVLNDYVKN